MVRIREELPDDIPAIRGVNDRAFGQAHEGTIVDRLREVCEGLLSLVAVEEGRVVGHILFSPVMLEAGRGMVHAMGLAPTAVLPEYQRQGIGSRLVRHGLDLIRGSSCPFVIVVGHPEYYPRFGFEQASKYGIQCQWEGVPDEAFMILVLDPAAMQGATGVARYRSEFDMAMWVICAICAR